MDNYLDKKVKSVWLRQNRYLPIVLWFFPLLLLNLGWYYFDYIDTKWAENERIEESKQEVEALEVGSEFSYCFGRIAGFFCEEIKSRVNIEKSEDRLINFIESRIKYWFRKPFPEHEIFFFKFSKANNKTNIIYPNEKSISGRKFLSIAFEYFFRVNSYDNDYSETERNSASKIAKSLLGGECDPSLIAETQRGKLFYSLYKYKPNCFLWDYFKNKKNGDVFGFFLITDNNKEAEKGSKLIALRELRDSQINKKNKKLGAFIPLFSGYDGVVANEEFTKLPHYKNYIRKWIPKNSEDLYGWVRNGGPKPEDSKIDGYQAFFYIASGLSHAAVLLVPLKDETSVPFWLIFINICVSLIIGILLIRGFLFGIWPQTSLKVRFITTYFLAACLPLGLLIIAFYGYISEYNHTKIFENQSQLKLCINQFDSRKTQSQDEYKTAFLELKNDANIIKAFKDYDKANQNLPKSFLPEAKKVLDLSLTKFNRENNKLPIISLTIIDERGSYISNIGNGRCQYFKDFNNKEYSNDIKINFEEENNKNLNENTMETLLFSFLQALRNKISDLDPGSKKWDNDKDIKPTLIQQTAIGGFRTANGGDTGNISEEFDKRRGVIITRLIGSRIVSHIHDYIVIDGVPRFFVYLIWDVSSLDDKSFNSSLSYFNKNKPNFYFYGFKAESQGVKYWISSTSHDDEFRKLSHKLANNAFMRKSYVSYRDDKTSMVATPLKNYNNTIIVGRISNTDFDLPIFTRIIIGIIIIILSLLVFLSCVYYSSKIFIEPITNLKNTLDIVAEGNYDIEIKSNSKDEFGSVCEEFSNMTKEISERSKLATLISDHAVEALSRNLDDDNSNDVEIFKGTVLVCDIRNFTGLCERYESNQITELLNEHFARMTEILSENGGRIYKYIGDAVEVVFVDRDDYKKSSVERAFVAAISMIDCLKRINQERINNKLFEYKIGVGLCYGNMSSGTIGSLETRLDYAIIGDAIKNAAKLESLSKLTPELPIVVDEQFYSIFKNYIYNADFIELENDEGIKCFKITDSIFNYFLEKNNNLKNRIKTSNKNETSDNKIKADKKYIIDYNFSFWNKFISGTVFITLFLFLLIGGGYFAYISYSDNNNILIASDNQRVSEQMLCEDYGKIAFDIKCRELTKKINDELVNNEKFNLKDEKITEIIYSVIDSDESIKGLDINHLFLKIEDYKNRINIKEKDFCEKIDIKPLANKGYAEREIKLICDSYKISLAIKEVDDFYKNDEESKFPCKYYIKDKYGEPCKEVFGDKALIVILNRDLANYTQEVTFRNEDSLLFTLDFYKKINNQEKLFGYIILSMPQKQAYSSYNLLSNSYSKNDSLVLFKNKKTNDWFFPKNTPKYLKDNLLRLNKNRNSEELESDYLKSICNVFYKEKVTIDDIAHDVYLIGLDNKYYNFYIIFTLSVLFIVICMFYILWNISKGKSSINYSVNLKLWLTLLIVAVLPVLTVLFVFSLYLNEFYSAKISQRRAEMQRFCDIFEEKNNLMNPLIWNYIKNKNKSEVLYEYIKILNNKNLPESDRIEAMKNLRSITGDWKDIRSKCSEIEDKIVNFYIIDLSIAGKNGWNFCYTDKTDSVEERKLDVVNVKEGIENKDDSLINVSYISTKVDSSTEAFGIMLTQIAKSLLNRRTSSDSYSNNRDRLTNEMVVETGLKVIRTFYGNDTFIKLSHGIDIPTILSIGASSLGMIISPIPNYDKPEAIIIWMVKFQTVNHYSRLYNIVNTEYDIYPAENFRYGSFPFIGNNDLRIPLGEYAAWIATSKLPVSTTLKLKDENYIIEGFPSMRQLNSLLIFSYPESKIMSEIYNMVLAFCFLVFISSFIIIVTTKNIAGDILDPIKALIIGIKEVNKENFSFRINSDRNDELGDLCLSFDKMVKGLEEKHLMSRMLSKTARLVTLDRNKKLFGKANSVLVYIGIPDFSLMKNKLSDYEIFANLKVQTAKIAKIIMEEGGEIDKIIGERILAVFRVDENIKQILQEASNAVKRIIELEKQNKFPFPVAIGLNYGNVINGFLGVGNKRDFTVIGDAVNVTARIESISEKLVENRCLVSDTFYWLAHDYINFKEYGNVKLKGKSHPIVVYQFV